MKYDYGSSISKNVVVPESVKHNPARKSRPEKLQLVTKNIVRTRKTESKGFIQSLIVSSLPEIGDYILRDVFLPAMKTLLVEMVQGGIEKLVHGDVDTKRRKKDGSPYDYTSHSDKKHRSPTGSRYTVDEIRFGTRREAERVLNELKALLREDGEVTVTDYYELVGEVPDYTDDRYGWESLRDAVVRPSKGGYVITLPRTISLY